MTVFADWESITIPDPDHSEDEERFLVVGLSLRRRMLVVSHAERGENTRIISARRADARERRKYGRENKAARRGAERTAIFRELALEVLSRERPKNKPRGA